MDGIFLDKKWHLLPLGEVFKWLRSNAKGLTKREVEERQSKFGPNYISEKNGDEIRRILNRQLKSPLVAILVAAGALSWILGDTLDLFIIWGTVVLNTAIGFSQEWKVSHILRKLKKFVTYKALVIRNGEGRRIDSPEVTVGDLIVLRPGERVPADARLVRAVNLRTNEAVLTGESLPVKKSAEVMKEDAPVADRKNMVFLGSFVEQGMGEAVVTAIGEETEFGRVAVLVRQERKHDQTPLQERLGGMAKDLGLFFVCLSFLLFVAGLARGHNVFSMFLTAVAVAVAAVPESLPVALSVTLAVGAKRVLAKGGLIRKMIAAEALGSTTVIAADKTATLTEGKTYLTKIISPAGQELPRQDFFALAETSEQLSASWSMKFLMLISNAVVEGVGQTDGSRQVSGSSIDRAITLTLLEAGLDRQHILEHWPRLAEIPFDAHYRYSASLHRFSAEHQVLIVLGAPETISGHSASFYGQEKSGEEWIVKKREMENRVNQLAVQGFKVLSLAFKYLPAKQKTLDRSLIKNLNFLSLVVFSDPLRKEVGEAVKMARKAGLRTIIITGDHLLTAKHVGQELGILASPGRIIEGNHLPFYLSKAVEDNDIFARVTPEDKVRIVEALKAKGEEVAMIGDGINDAPALLRSDIGVAVGSGTDVAREAADLILINDSFSIVVEAIRQGRIILDNIKKTLVFLLGSAFSEIILISGSILAGLPLALLPAQILWVNVVADSLPSIALAFEKEEAGIMHRRPEKSARVFTKEMKKLIALFTGITDLALFLLFAHLWRTTGNLDYARTVAFVGLGLASLFYIYAVRSLRQPFWKINFWSNRWLNGSVFAGGGLYLLASYWPALNRLLGTVPLGWRDWSILLILAVLNLLVLEGAKRIFLKTPWRKNRDTWQGKPESAMIKEA